MNKRGRPATGRKVISGGITMTEKEWKVIDKLKGDSSRGEWLRNQLKDTFLRHGATIQ